MQLSIWQININLNFYLIVLPKLNHLKKIGQKKVMLKPSDTFYFYDLFTYKHLNIQFYSILNKLSA